MCGGIRESEGNFVGQWRYGYFQHKYDLRRDNVVPGTWTGPGPGRWSRRRGTGRSRRFGLCTYPFLKRKNVSK